MKPKNVLVMLLLVAVCAVAFFLLPEHGADTGDKLPAVMPVISKRDVTQITASGQGSEIKLKRREPTSDRWELVVGTELVRADGNKVDDLLAALSTQLVLQKIPQAELGGADYGLKAPTLEIDLIVAEKPMLLRYGSATREGQKVYMDTGAGTDVWVVTKDAMNLAISYISGDVKDVRLFDSTPFDVAKLEILEGGVTVMQLEKDHSQIWRYTQPFKGYPHPQRIDAALDSIANVNVDKWVELGAQALGNYGLDKPAREVRLTPKGEGKKTEVVLVGAGDESGCFAMEEGTRAVVRLGPKFRAAVMADPNAWRDRSFTRLGIDGTTIDVQTGPMRYKLVKAGSTWDVTIGSESHPADGAKVNRLLDRIRGWETVEFLDSQRPEDVGIDGKDFVEISLEAMSRDTPGKLVLYFGKRGPDDKSIYAQRKDDGQVERVDAGPLDEMLKGPHQYFRGVALEWPTDWIMGLQRSAGTDEGKDVQNFGIERRSVDKPWESTGAGLAGQLDAEAINAILGAVRKVENVEWFPFSPEKDNERMGFHPPNADTLTLEATLGGVFDMKNGGLAPNPKLYVGKPIPAAQGGGYYARTAEERGWAFRLSAEVVEKLKRALAK